MKNSREIVDIIKSSIYDAYTTFAGDKKNLIGEGEYNIKVGDERILDSLTEPNEQESPKDLTKANTIYIVIKLGNGQCNMAVTNFTCELQAISEDGTFDIAQGILRQLIEDVNFEYKNGIIQAFFEPDVAQENVGVFSGVRAVLACRGNIIVPESDPALSLITNVLMSFDNGTTWAELPFIHVSYHWQTAEDPQAFPPATLGQNINLATGVVDHGGWASSKNKQSVLVLGFTTYLFDFRNEVTGYDCATKAAGWKTKGWMKISHELFAIQSGNDINSKIRIRLKTPLADNAYFVDCYFNMTLFSFDQPWGNVAPIMLSFSKTA